MARTKNRGYQQTLTPTYTARLWKMGGYIRLSREDLQKINRGLDDSNSVKNQRDILNDFHFNPTNILSIKLYKPTTTIPTIAGSPKLIISLSGVAVSNIFLDDILHPLRLADLISLRYYLSYLRGCGRLLGSQYCPKVHLKFGFYVK